MVAEQPRVPHRPVARVVAEGALIPGGEAEEGVEEGIADGVVAILASDRAEAAAGGDPPGIAEDLGDGIRGEIVVGDVIAGIPHAPRSRIGEARKCGGSRFDPPGIAVDRMGLREQPSVAAELPRLEHHSQLRLVGLGKGKLRDGIEPLREEVVVGDGQCDEAIGAGKRDPPDGRIDVVAVERLPDPRSLDR